MNLEKRAASLVALNEVVEVVRGEDFLQSDDKVFIKLNALARSLDAAIAYSIVAKKGNAAIALVAVNSDAYCPDLDDPLIEAVGNNAVAGLLVYDMQRPAVVARRYLPLKEILFAYVFPENRSDAEKLLGVYQTDSKVLMTPMVHDFLKILPRVKHAISLDQFREPTTELEPIYYEVLRNILQINHSNLPQFPKIELTKQTEETKTTETEKKS